AMLNVGNIRAASSRSRIFLAKMLLLGSLITLFVVFCVSTDGAVAVPESINAASTTVTAPSSSPFIEFSTDTKLWMVRIHGIMMVIPWFSLIPSAMLAARYLRIEWRAHKPGGLQIWFHIHRSLNWFSLPLLIVSTLLVIAAKGFKWTGPYPGKNPQKQFGPGSLHSLVGAIALVGVVLQFVFALNRPSPQSNNRPYFNLIHRSIGVISQLFAVAAIIFASTSFLKYWKYQVFAVVLTIIAPVLILTTVIVLELQSRRHVKSEIEEIEMSGQTSAIRVESPTNNLKITFFVCSLIFFVISIAISVQLI
ncbi:hypothetical protein PMAYCL1PPCAC_04390, partial [Pristionchus mayeri]